MATKYQELDGRHVYKTQEVYKDVIWNCKGTSYESMARTKAAWQRNKEKRIAKIDGAKDQKEGRVRLDKVLPEWYDMYKRHEVKGGRPRSKRTIDTDEDTIKQICTVLGGNQVCDIESDTVQRYLLSLVNQGESNSTIKKRWNMLNMFFRHVYPDGGNPLARCKRPESAQKTSNLTIEDDDEPTDKLAYTDEAMVALAAELAKSYDVHVHSGNGRGYLYGNIIIVIMYEFLRVSEAIELRVKDVDWGHNIIRLRRQYDEKNKMVTPPKYGSRREIPIMAECRNILQAACLNKEPNDLLFTAGQLNELKHGGYILQGGLRRILNLACVRVGLQKHTIHDLRHDGISRVVRALPNDPSSVQLWAGHKSLAVTYDKYYRHNGIINSESLEKMTGIQ